MSRRIKLFILNSSDIPIIGQYTDETNIANWIGMMKKKNITLDQIQSGVTDYVNEKVQLSDYDNKWLKIYNNIPPSSSIDNDYTEPDLEKIS
tara:strand:+ start:595 stop:870 length:276 start_codon:yes stop_codon:yes gene_type:complete